MKKNMVVLQDKIAEVNNNGTSEIAPDNGYDGLGKVALTVNVAGGGDMSKYALKTDVEAETTARTQADTVLQSNIEAETAARIKSDELLQLNIDTRQGILVSGQNIMTINGTDILQAGNLEVQGTPGPKGDTGPQGEQGLQGPKGDPGEKGQDGAVGPQGPIGEQGLQGPAGERGPQGIQGERGPQGEKGKDGAGVNIIDDLPSETNLPEEGKTGDAYLVNGELWVWVGTGGDSTNGKFKNVGNIKGPKGDKGEQGIQGPKGDTGAQGETGPAGERGPQGEPGAKGDTGEKGTDGAVGPQGPTGERGPAGETGPRGEQGPAGPDNSYILEYEKDYTDTVGGQPTEHIYETDGRKEKNKNLFTTLLENGTVKSFFYKKMILRRYDTNMFPGVETYIPTYIPATVTYKSYYDVSIGQTLNKIFVSYTTSDIYDGNESVDKVVKQYVAVFKEDGTLLEDWTEKPLGGMTEAEADAKYLQSVPAEYVTDTELAQKGYITEIPAEYITETELTGKNYVDTTTLEGKGYLTAVPEGYATTAYVDEKIGQIDNVLKTI